MKNTRASTLQTLAILGAGKMGCDIAACFAAGGWQVHLYDPVATARETLPARLRTALQPLRAPRSAFKRITAHGELPALPWPSVTLVIEAAPEKLVLKQMLMQEAEGFARGNAVLATNSSSLKVADVAKYVKNKSRVAGMHFLTPANIAPLVEVVRSKHTSAQTIRRINAWLGALGKLSVNLNRDITGMIVNRVQGAMMREIFHLIDQGIATPADVDTAVRHGFGYRYIACGPLRQRDFNGLEIHRDAAAQIYPTLHNGWKPARCLENLVRRGHLGVRTGRGFYRWKKAALKRELEEYEQTLAAALQLMR